MVAQARLPASALRLRVFGLTDVGCVRAANEDALGMADLGTKRRWDPASYAMGSTSAPGILLAVSDGMGGAKAGEVASALSIDGVVAGMLEASRMRAPDGETLRRVVERVSRRVHEASRQPEHHGMGATLTAVLVSGMNAYVAQIGDSRAYLLRGDHIGQVTHDQSYVQLLVDAGVMTPAEAEKSPRRNIILQVMGQESVKVALGRIKLARGDRLLLCSDGLTNVLADDEIRRISRAPNDPKRAVQQLLRRTRDEGAPDNVTAVLADLT
jgi:PPM family protein phosphatase